MAAETRTTTDHEEIRRWVEEHGGKPATIRGTARDGEAGLLTIDFPGGTGDDRLEHIDWDEWFRKFDENNLAFVYQASRADGGDSTFFRLVHRDSVEERAQSR
ncbi:MAG TPA: hypothetical protein VGK51_00980 [Actinomycetota bacterium]|jgi:hypothetical protein